MQKEIWPLLQRTCARNDGQRLQLAISALESSLEIERLGAIYSLETLAKNGERREYELDAWSESRVGYEAFGTELLVEVLTALVRRHSQIEGAISPEVQAALTVLGRTKIRRSTPIDLHGISLREAYLPFASLGGAFLYDCDFEGSIFCNANLSGAWLWRANLKRVNFDGADLRGADITGATGVTIAQVEAAVFDENTRWPTFE
jgi:hypothetical protein